MESDEEPSGYYDDLVGGSESDDGPILADNSEDDADLSIGGFVVETPKECVLVLLFLN
jgi:hypothetical protein